MLVMVGWIIIYFLIWCIRKYVVFCYLELKKIKNIIVLDIILKSIKIVIGSYGWIIINKLLIWCRKK